LKLPPVYAITDRAAAGIDDVPEIARRLLAVGVRCLQVREKAAEDRPLLDAVESVASLARASGASVLVNDRVDVARIAGVGVHVGGDDLPAREARSILGEGALIGVSTHDWDAARSAFADPAADYVAFGPVFGSATKTDRPASGLDALARVAAVKTKPLVAIGGITADRLDGVWDAGADSAAMVRGLLSGGRIEENARRALDAARRRRAGRVYLVGFMGSGKTTVGSRLAERLGVPFVDIDAEIERTSGRTVRALFEEQGEEVFRAREAAFLAATADLPRAVIATGGGCFARAGNREAIARLGASVFLDVPFDMVRGRLAGKTDRPLFQSVEQLRGLFAERSPFYTMASARVELSGTESIDEAADKVLRALEDRERLSA
jgi:thiamine-phosphate pyrophosphorylase